jgi:uncharacterized cupredoxin-like copper-binding protein
MRKSGFLALTALAVLLSLLVLGGVTRATPNTQTAAGTPCASPVASPSASPMASPQASPSASPMASPASCAPAASGTGLQVQAGDLFFKPATLALPANTSVTITITNGGALPHNFNIDQLNIHTPDIAPGQSAQVTVKGAAGTYQYYCSIPGHKQAGMVGTLTIK